MTTAAALGWAWAGIVTLAAITGAVFAVLTYLIKRREALLDAAHRLTVETNLAVMIAHANLSDAHVREVVRQGANVPEVTAAKVLEKVAPVLPPLPPEGHDDIPVPPPPLKASGETPCRQPAPHAPPPPVPKDDPNARPLGGPSLKSGAFLTLVLVGFGTMYAAPFPEARAMDGRVLFDKGCFIEAAEAYREQGDRHTAAACLVEGKAYDMAVAELDGLSDGRADYIRGLAADCRGDRAAAVALFELARDKGDDLAPLKLKQLGKG